ncbi:Acetyltransferase (GNAT) family protein [Pelagimonas phthalicica]|uniref:Acetyltransferase (GNAT) family protein n=1 Tax=Pelagimonas phthalicica TaxID=1037362 RepID=A0A238J9Q0_9RHOB|nr:GNAT family N-acetyltransferase [Pelagimonas phthalicica]TDS94156.1 L-amino acid N-acyltransferase YncA [Pelagimonas phthalicica]SMX27319.1 Acetyltransferase (GNAT) family protein [Pelagimonas phthalicica]
MIVINPTLDEVLPLFRALHNFHVCLSPHIYHAEGADEAYLDILRSALSEGGRIYAVDAGWGLVAYLLALQEDRTQNGLRRGGRRIKIDHLYIAPTHRGLGLGHQLVARMEQDMRDQGISRWVVSQDATNLPATDFYRSVGAVDRALMLEKYL